MVVVEGSVVVDDPGVSEDVVEVVLNDETDDDEVTAGWGSAIVQAATKTRKIDNKAQRIDKSYPPPVLVRTPIVLDSHPHE